MSGIDLARRAACALITGVIDGRQTLAEQISEGVLEGLSGPERARAQRLSLDTLRNLARIDAMLKPHLRRPPPSDVLAVLRLAVCELCLEAVPAHGVVNAAVALIHSGGRKIDPFAGLVNAVLRKVAQETDRWQTLPVPALPGWLRGRMMSAWGKVATMQIEAAHLATPPLDISAKGDASALAAELKAGFQAELLPTGSIRLPQGTQVTALPGYEAGNWWVQDAAAALAAKAVAAKPGEAVLDLCAAPGGKTLQLAATGADVTALDISPARLGRLRENLERCGLSADVIAADAMAWEPETPFDAILLDAPCSATGTIRRHPDLPFVKQSSDIRELAALQQRLFDRALGWLKPGGRLIYCTCSLLPDEGEAQIAGALERHPLLRVDPITLPGVDPDWQTSGGGLRLRPDFWPDRGGMDGFFIARLVV